MRKLRITAVLVAAGVVAASGAFAQEIKFEGYVNSGIGIMSTDAKASDIKVVPFGVDSEQPGYRFRLSGSYTGEEGNAGAKFRLQAQSKFDYGALSIPYAYGWASFLDKVLTVSGGLVDDKTWESGGFYASDVDEGLGALVKLSPIDGLTLGVGAYVISPQGGSDNNILIIPAGEEADDDEDLPVTDFSKVDIGLDRLKYTVGVGYTLPDLFKATASFRTANQTANGVSKYADADLEEFSSRETMKLILSAQILAVKDLKAVVEAVFDKLEDTGKDKDKDNIDVDLYETLEYKISDLTLGLNVAEYIRIEKDKDHDLGLHFNPWVSYAIGSIVPRLDLNYFLAGKALTTPTDDPKKAAAWGTAYGRTVFGYKDNVSVIGVRPSVKFNVGKGFVEIGDFIAYAMGPEGSFADEDDPKKSSSFNNVVYVDFKWSF
ncbi:MAG: hypothetical protein LBU16_00665 [Treponema sp.]|jgi:hypothetical protein|nr:hypothetical protein [Treponema sp.]